MARKLTDSQRKAMFAKAKSMVSGAGFKTTKVDETGRSFRFRQRNPSMFKKDSFRTLDIGRPGYLKAVVGRLKRDDGRKKTRIQSVFISKGDLR